MDAGGAVRLQLWSILIRLVVAFIIGSASKRVSYPSVSFFMTRFAPSFILGPFLRLYVSGGPSR